MNNKVILNMKRHGANLSKFGCSDEDAIRFLDEESKFRTSFFRDIDRVLYSLSYVRYIDKTQVFSNIDNDMISKRMIHVQFVSKIARTIGRALGLNEDLIEAASLGHDLGHVPLGHAGEIILNKLSLKYGEGYFNHNVQSVRTLMVLENGGSGNNISLQVLDAILCHNGEIISGIYEPVSKDKNQFLFEYNESYKNKEILKDIRPMTLEGCVVRISDVIAYIGKDIEDAIRLGKILKTDIPSSILNVLGDSTSSIINTIVLDIVDNSFDKNYIKMSDAVYSALKELIDFNYKNIYLKANTLEELNEYEEMFSKLFDLYYKHLNEEDYSSDIYTLFLNDMNDAYNESESNARKVIDYIAGMTDDFLISQYNKYFN